MLKEGWREERLVCLSLADSNKGCAVSAHQGAWLVGPEMVGFHPPHALWGHKGPKLFLVQKQPRKSEETGSRWMC